MNTQYRKNLKAVAQACKDYTDDKIKKVYYDIGHNDITTEDHTNELAYQITAPAGAKLLQLMSVGGNTVKLSPSVASDSTKAMIKTMPATVYDFDGSKFYGDSEVSDNLLIFDNGTTSMSNVTITRNNGSVTFNGTNTSIAYYDFFNNETKFPNGINAGDTLTFIVFEPNAYVGYQIYERVNNSWSIKFTTSTSTSITLSSNATGLIIRVLSSTDSRTYNNVTTYPMLVKGLTVPSEWKRGFSGIHNIELSGLKAEGSNLANPSLFELGSISTTSGSIGQDVPNNSRMRSNYIEVKPNTVYTLNYDNYNVNYFQYDKEYRCISNAVGGTFTTGATTKYVRFYGGVIDENTKVLFNEGTNTTYIPYVSQTIPIDLTTIVDSNNNKLFPNGKLMGNANVKDVLGVYNQESKWVDLLINGSEAWYKNTGWSSEDNISMYFRPTILPVNGTLNLFCTDNTFTLKGNVVLNSTTTDEIRVASDAIYVNFTRGGGKINEFTLEKAKQWLANNLFILQYERATYLTSNTDLSAILRNIQGYPNGSIIAENTHNMDVESVITYNSIIQETLCPSVTVDGANLCPTISKELTNNALNTLADNIYLEVGEYTLKIDNGTATYPNSIQIRDINNTLLFDQTNNTIVTKTFTISDSGYYKITCWNVKGVYTYNPQVMLNRGSTALSYRPYKPSITRNLPTQASDGWSAGTSRNYRVFCDYEGNEVSKRENNVNKNNNLGALTWTLNSSFDNVFNCNDLSSVIKAGALDIYANILMANYSVSTSGIVGDIDMSVAVGGTSVLYIHDVKYDNANIFKTAMTNEPLYYELADASKTETDMDDFDYFFDVEEGDVITFNNPYAQQVYATYSFLIKEAKSNE